MSVYQLYREQKIPSSIDAVWSFISNPANLPRITPKDLGLEIVSGNLPDEIYPGLMILYKVKPFLSIQTEWVTEITHVKEPEYFVDEQRSGPYRIWHHEHRLVPLKDGVLMTDLITYKISFGFIGKIINNLVVKKRLSKIFSYRKKAIIDIFGIFQTGN